MDILSHTLSGLAVGTVFASIGGQNRKQRMAILLGCTLAGALPDIDAISLWSHFDGTIGRLLGLPHRGTEIYFGKYWYSHHGFMHSLLAGVLYSLALSLLVYGKSLRKGGYKIWWQQGRWLLLSTPLAFSVHLLEDMPTPACTWGGIRLLFPTSAYYGGTGEIWWWNNYDIFLIILFVILINALILLFRKRLRFPAIRMTLCVFLLGCSLSLYQIKTRPFDFAYSNHTPRYQEYEAKSKEVQREILGERVYSAMEWLDRQLPFYF